MFEEETFYEDKNSQSVIASSTEKINAKFVNYQTMLEINSSTSALDSAHQAGSSQTS